MHVLPRAYGYKIYEEVVQLANGELSKKFIYVYHDHRGDEFRARLKLAKAKADADVGSVNASDTKNVTV